MSRTYDPRWWKQQCPERGVTLTHTHASQCRSEHEGHTFDQCCHCGAVQPDTEKATMVMPPIDVAARLRALGYKQIPEPPVDEPEPAAPDPYFDETAPREPLSVTGQGPTGPRYGLGRGILTPRAERRAVAYVGWRAWLAEHGGGEQA